MRLREPEELIIEAEIAELKAGIRASTKIGKYWINEYAGLLIVARGVFVLSVLLAIAAIWGWCR